MVLVNQSYYLDMNALSDNDNEIIKWSDDDRFRFENKVLLIVKEITKQIQHLQTVLGVYYL